MLNHPPTPAATPVATLAVDVAQAQCIADDLAYEQYKNSGAKLRDEIAAAVTLEKRWSQGGAA